MRFQKERVVWCRKRSSEMSAGIDVDGWKTKGKQTVKLGNLLALGNGIAKERVLKKQ